MFIRVLVFRFLILRPSQHVYPCFSLQIFDSEAVSTCLSVFQSSDFGF